MEPVQQPHGAVVQLRQPSPQPKDMGILGQSGVFGAFLKIEQLMHQAVFLCFLTVAPALHGQPRQIGKQRPCHCHRQQHGVQPHQQQQEYREINQLGQQNDQGVPDALRRSAVAAADVVRPVGCCCKRRLLHVQIVGGAVFAGQVIDDADAHKYTVKQDVTVQIALQGTNGHEPAAESQHDGQQAA